MALALVAFQTADPVEYINDELEEALAGFVEDSAQQGVQVRAESVEHDEDPSLYAVEVVSEDVAPEELAEVLRGHVCQVQGVLPVPEADRYDSSYSEAE